MLNIVYATERPCEIGGLDLRAIIPDLGHGSGVGLFDSKSVPLLIDCGTTEKDKKTSQIS